MFVESDHWNSWFCWQFKAHSYDNCSDDMSDAEPTEEEDAAAEPSVSSCE